MARLVGCFALLAAIAALQACQFPWALRPDKSTWALASPFVRILDDRLGGHSGDTLLYQEFEILDDAKGVIRPVRADLVCAKRTFTCVPEQYKLYGKERRVYQARWELDRGIETTVGDQCTLVITFEGAEPVHIPYRRFRPEP